LGDSEMKYFTVISSQ